MFRNLTLAQQMFFFVLAVFLILLVFRILVKLKLAPVLLYAACANLIFPEWVAEQKALYWAILAGLVLVTIFRWVGPRLTAHMEEQRIMREIVEQSRAADALLTVGRTVTENHSSIIICKISTGRSWSSEKNSE